MVEGITRKNIRFDKVRHLSTFDVSDSEQLKIAVHYKSKQPLLEIDNLVEGSKYTEHVLMIDA